MLELDKRKYTLLPDFNITDEFMRCGVMSYLAYLEPEVFLLKWNQYKTESIIEKDLDHFYSEREIYVSEIFKGVNDMPIYYDGMLNATISRDAQGYLIHKNNTQYFIFRGTGNVLDVISDLDFIQVPFESFPNVKVHRGFYMQFLSIKDSLIKDLDPTKKIVFTAHSLGSSVATLAAVYFGNLYKDADITLITFACPKTGNHAFAQLFHKTVNLQKTYRFVTEKDAVPLVAAMYDYVHVSDAYCIKEDCVMLQEYDVHWLVAFYHAMVKTPVYMHAFNTYIKTLFALKAIEKTSA